MGAGHRGNEAIDTFCTVFKGPIPPNVSSGLKDKRGRREADERGQGLVQHGTFRGIRRNHERRGHLGGGPWPTSAQIRAARLKVWKKASLATT